MNNLIYIGKIVNTHGLKGEIRIISDFKFKSDVFKTNNIVYIDNKKYVIKSYRQHKQYDMVTLDGVETIDLAENFKGLNIYIDRNDYSFDGYLKEDIINLDVYDNSIYKGKVVDVLRSNKYELLVIDGIKRHLVPNIPEFVKNIDLNNKRINIEYIRGLDNED